MSEEPFPLGARWDGAGTTFAVVSSVATRIELHLDGPDGDPSAGSVVELARSGDRWHVRVAGVGPGRRYGYRVWGPPPCDPAKLLVDPYARAIEGELRWSERLLTPGVDSGPDVPRSVVTGGGLDPADRFDWQGDRPPNVAWPDTVIYEAHVEGLTARHPDVPAELRGTYLALAQPAVTDHLRRLGVTAVELLPVHHFVSERRLVESGLRNYWGYNTLGFFAPHAGYSARPGQQATELKTAVRALHRAGLEVLLDVVYNHTAEGGSDGPVLSLRGFDAAAYYRGDHHRPGSCIDWTGCGNTLDLDQPAALALVLDSLRHWVREYHVDGFRFDLATVLGRRGGWFERTAPFFEAVAADPVLSTVKLIAEPWDLGPDGYQLGRFPAGWAEWNGRYRDGVRDFWSGRPGSVGRLAESLAGSAVVFRDPARGPLASVNYAACHDGFTLRDLVSYERKHNLANGEGGHDGTDDNRSWNCGVEGPTADPEVTALRRRQQRNLLATVFLSHGVPMLGHGDEAGRTQGGNNNAYCQANGVSYLDWAGMDADLVAFVEGLARLRRDHVVLRRTRWAAGRAEPPTGAVDLAWYTPRGTLMTEWDWHDPCCRTLVAVLDGRAAHSGGARWDTPSLVVVLNAADAPVLCRLPATAWPGVWRRLLDTDEAAVAEGSRRYLSGERVGVEPHSLVVLAPAA